MDMLTSLSRVICSDVEYDQLCTDIYLSKRFLCRLSWEAGPSKALIEFPAFSIENELPWIRATKFRSFLEESYADLTSSEMNQQLIEPIDCHITPSEVSISDNKTNLREDITILIGREAAMVVSSRCAPENKCAGLKIQTKTRCFVSYFDFIQKLNLAIERTI